jgi:hypothetical protein
MGGGALMTSIMQTVLVAAVVCGAAAFVLWRIVGPWFTAPGKPGCPSCASGDHCADKPASEAPSSDVHPLVVVRTRSR